MKSVRAFVQYDDYSNDIRLGIAIDDDAKDGLTVLDFQATEIVRGEYREPPRFPVQGVKTRAVIQAIVDAAWKVGIKPEGSKDTAGQEAAMRQHLRDMRRIAFVKLNVPEPEGQ